VLSINITLMAPLNNFVDLAKELKQSKGNIKGNSGFFYFRTTSHLGMARLKEST